MAKWEEVAAGSFWELADLRQYEPLLEEGARGLLELDLRLPVSENVAKELEDKLREAGVADVKVRRASPMLQIFFRKGFPWLAVIAVIIIAFLVLAALIVGWRLFKDVPEAAPVFAIVGLGLLALAVVLLTRKEL